MDPFALVGTVAFALAGYLVAVRRQLDLLGIVLLAGLTATGGGVLRDVMLGDVPRIFAGNVPFHRSSAALVLGTVGAAWTLRVHRLEGVAAKVLYTLSDSMGLVAFALSGAETALAAGVNATGVVLLAFVSAVGGGLVRDALVSEVPTLLYEDFYGTVALLVGAAMAVSRALGIPPGVAAPWVFGCALFLRLLAAAFGLRLPRVGR